MSNATRKHRKADGVKIIQEANSFITLMISNKSPSGKMVNDPATTIPASSPKEAAQKGIEWLRGIEFKD